MNRDINKLLQRKKHFKKIVAQETKKGRKVHEVVFELSETYFLSERQVYRDIST